MKARITFTPELLKRVLDKKPLNFKFPKAVTEVEIVVSEDEDVFERFDRVFNKLVKKALDKLDK